jgi:hypothetical protein
MISAILHAIPRLHGTDVQLTTIGRLHSINISTSTSLPSRNSRNKVNPESNYLTPGCTWCVPACLKWKRKCVGCRRSPFDSGSGDGYGDMTIFFFCLIFLYVSTSVLYYGTAIRLSTIGEAGKAPIGSSGSRVQPAFDPAILAINPTQNQDSTI